MTADKVTRDCPAFLVGVSMEHRIDRITVG